MFNSSHLIGDLEIDNFFTYHPPTEIQQKKYSEIREAAKVFAKVIRAHCPPSADRTDAIRKVREAVMTANASIACYKEKE